MTCAALFIHPGLTRHTNTPHTRHTSSLVSSSAIVKHDYHHHHCCHSAFPPFPPPTPPPSTSPRPLPTCWTLANHLLPCLPTPLSSFRPPVKAALFLPRKPAQCNEMALTATPLPVTSPPLPKGRGGEEKFKKKKKKKKKSDALSWKRLLHGWVMCQNFPPFDQ